MKIHSCLSLLALCAGSCLALVPCRVSAGAVDEMAAAIERDLPGRCIGYGYALYLNGAYQTGSGGGSAKMGDPDNVFDLGIPFDENTVKDCHSMSKTITAAAMIKALAAANVPPAAPGSVACRLRSMCWHWPPVRLPATL